MTTLTQSFTRQNGTASPTQPAQPAGDPGPRPPLLCRLVCGQAVDPFPRVTERTVIIYHPDERQVRTAWIKAQVSVALYDEPDQGLQGLVILDTPNGGEMSEARALSLAARVLSERLAAVVKADQQP